jgi:hypothetical protein
MSKQEAFDLEAVYDEQIQPLMEKIVAICKEHKLPVFASFLYANDPEGDADFCTTNVMPEEWNRPIPGEMLKLVDVIYPHRVPPLRLTVKNADGQTTEETIILG